MDMQGSCMGLGPRESPSDACRHLFNGKVQATRSLVLKRDCESGPRSITVSVLG